VFEVLEMSTSTLNNASEIAMRLVLMPAIRNAYESVLIRWMIKVRMKTSVTCAFIILFLTRINPSDEQDVQYGGKRSATPLWIFRLRWQAQRAAASDLLECGGKRSATPLWIRSIAHRCIVTQQTLPSTSKSAADHHSLSINFSRGSIASSPLCCQQRTAPETRREQGVPFFVRAPQM
jgi:hypothetical protein